jgi:hypothetical protein
MNDPFSLDGRINALERRTGELNQRLTTVESRTKKLARGNTMESRGFALWCKPGMHPFGDDDLGRKPITTTDDDDNEVTFWMCSEHKPEYMKPGAKPKMSLKAIKKMIDDVDIDE